MDQSNRNRQGQEQLPQLLNARMQEEGMRGPRNVDFSGAANMKSIERVNLNTLKEWAKIPKEPAP